ncbi:MAG TPA: ABC transporter ATP-binding protein [Spirochaetia bacterium]|nr:ABC transporter ATP-binding protein [Spirochaetia bacterium]
MSTIVADTKIPIRELARFLGRYLRPRLALVLCLGVTLFSGIGLQLVNPQLLRSFIDGATAGAPLASLVRLALWYIGIAVAQQLVNVLNVLIAENLGWGTTNALRLDAARHCLGLDMSFHSGHTPGEMIERLDGDVMALSNFFSRFILEVVGSALLVLGILLVLLREDWRITVALAGFAGVTSVVCLTLARIAVSSWEAERQSSANLYGFLEERLGGTEDIRANNAVAWVLDRFYRLTRDQMQKTITAGLKVNILLNSMWFAFAVGTALAYLVGSALYRAGSISIGTVYMIVNYTVMLFWPLDRITQQVQDLQKAIASVARIVGLLRLTGRIPGEGEFAVGQGSRPTAGPLGVSFDRVSFSYDEGGKRETVLRDVSFRLAPGKVLGLLGRTGSGKTTLTRLIFRLYDPEHGGIRLHAGHPGAAPDGVDVRGMAVRDLRRRVGLVPQNIQLFNATVRENLAFFDDSVPDARIVEAIRALGLGPWLDALPRGLDTELESGGGGLSAGEAQLLAFTRIFLRDPGLVILDEATSRLDPATESRIEAAVDTLVRDRTAIIVAHRLRTVQRADEILILEEGRTLESGTRPELAADPGSRFHRLLETGLEEVLT